MLHKLITNKFIVWHLRIPYSLWVGWSETSCISIILISSRLNVIHHTILYTWRHYTVKDEECFYQILERWMNPPHLKGITKHGMFYFCITICHSYIVDKKTPWFSVNNFHDDINSKCFNKFFQIFLFVNASMHQMSYPINTVTLVLKYIMKF